MSFQQSIQSSPVCNSPPNVEVVCNSPSNVVSRPTVLMRAQKAFHPEPRECAKSGILLRAMRPQGEDLIFCPVCALYAHQNCVMLRAGGVQLLAFFFFAGGCLDQIRYGRIYQVGHTSRTYYKTCNKATFKKQQRSIKGINVEAERWLW